MKKLTRKWILIFLAFILPVVIMAAYSFSELKRNMTDYIHKEKTSVAGLTSTILRERFDRVRDLGISLATRVRFRRLVSENRWEEATSILNDVPGNYPYIQRIFITDTAGVLRGDIPEAEPSVRGMDFSYRDWFRGVRRQWRPYVSEVYRRKATPSYNVVSVAVPVRSGEPPRTVLGIVVLQIKLNTLLEWSREIGVGNTGSITIIDHRGRVAASARYRPQDDIVDYSGVTVVGKALGGEKGIGEFYNPVEEEIHLVAYRRVRDYGWGVLVEQPLEAAYSEMNASLRFVLVIYSVILLIALLFAYLILKNMGKKMRAEEATRQKARELEEANKELEQFVYVASHDLQEPLRTIANFTELIRDKYSGKSEKDDRHLKFIIDSVARMQNLIRDLLDLSKVGRDDTRTRVDCNEILKEVTGEMETAIRECSATISAGPLPVVKGNSWGLKQLFQNLISNAIKFRKVDVPPELAITAGEKNGEYVFAFRDNGIGFDTKYADRIFTVFQRLHSEKEYPGTGIGLTTCLKIVSRHNGKMWVGSKPGEGSAFYFTIPKNQT